MNPNSQNARVLAALQRGARMTPRDALNRFGCFRLAARIKDLRDAGHDIVTHRVYDATTLNPYAQYVLIRSAKPHGLDASEGEE